MPSGNVQLVLTNAEWLCLQPSQAQEQCERDSTVTVTARRDTPTGQQLTELPWVLLGTLRG